jgi:diketogulonate reductase-like aldo/keto reductase
MERDDRGACVAALRRGVELGLIHIDTAELYGRGRVEEIVGEAIEGCRDRVFLVSKVQPDHASRAGTIRACEASLRRLRTDHLDCYLLHWEGAEPLEDTIAGFEALRAEGKIRSWGLSNFDTRALEHTAAIAGHAAIACNQVLYHLGERRIEHAVIPWCKAHDVAVVAYSPFGSGRFPKRHAVLAAIAREAAATPYAVALAYLARDRSVFVIPKAASAAHVEENAAAARLVLTEEQVARIDAAFPRGRPMAGVPVL